MIKINNKLCNVNSIKYDEETKKLSVQYKLNIKKTYNGFTKESYDKLIKQNNENKTVGKILKSEICKSED